MMSYLLDSDKTWLLEEADAKSSRTLAQESGLSTLSAAFLIKRGISSAHEVKKFFNPASNMQEDPIMLPDIKKASQRIMQAIKNDELIYIHGDYDVDGITSTTLLYEILKKMKAKVRYHIPCRFNEGYGLNKKSLNKIINEGAKLLITVDCGIKSFSEVNYAKKKGLDVVITDHHEPGEKWPSALAVVNPKLPHSNSSNRDIAGVGVSLKLAQVLTDDSLDQYYDLVALGTVADIAPLLNENRYFAKKGLSLLNNKKRLGLEKLAEVAGVKNRKVTSETLGYILAPRLNASGRISNANVCVELLTTNDESKAQEIAQLLNNANKKRKQIEQKML
ncbi:MAG: single-stranded-DNA-specific exonuclease RecJ, partial [Actinobacteria bacterium]